MKAVSLTGAPNSAPAERSGANNTQTDPICQNIQNRIAGLRERMQSISSDENMSSEDKMKKDRRYSRKSPISTSSSDSARSNRERRSRPGKPPLRIFPSRSVNQAKEAPDCHRQVCRQ